jgi:hypothetical protein
MQRVAADDIPSHTSPRHRHSARRLHSVSLLPSRAPQKNRLASSEPVEVIAVIPATGLEDGVTLAGAEVLAVRQIAVLLEEAALGADSDLARRVDRYRRIVEFVFRDRAIVPVPFGTVFRSRASVARWLELHYSPLNEALDFVADRATMRVRLGASGTPANEAAATALDNRLWNALRNLKGDAVAALPVTPNADTKPDYSATCSYLIERGAIGAFQERVARLTSAEPHLRIELSGPLPAYDFVRMEFGG